MMVALSDRILMSAEEYLAWELTQDERHEYWDGEVVAMSGGTKNHNRVSGNAFNSMFKFLGDCPINETGSWF
jgi:Uma2 family endonuclease